MNAFQDNGDWSVYIALFVAGGFPWITQIKDLDIHFSFRGQSFREIFNAFASLFSFSIFFFMKTAVSDKFAYYFNLWWIILMIAFVLVVIYLALLLANKTPTLKGMLVRFIVYVCIFCTLVSGFGLLYFEKDYYMISGTVGGVKGQRAKMDIYVDGSVNKSIYTDDHGNFYLTLKKNLTYENIVVNLGGNDRTFYIYDPIFTSFQDLAIEPDDPQQNVPDSTATSSTPPDK